MELRYTKEFPNQKGWYWVKDEIGNQHIYETIFHTNLGWYIIINEHLYCESYLKKYEYEFAGPIPEPLPMKAQQRKQNHE